jgi:hypothetical protein
MLNRNFLGCEQYCIHCNRKVTLVFGNNQLYPLVDFDKGIPSGSMIYLNKYLYAGRQEGWVCKDNVKTKKFEWCQSIKALNKRRPGEL